MRSFSINPPVGGPSEPTCGGVPWLDFANFRVFSKLSDMVDPGPSRTFVFLDERVETLAEGVFYLSMNGYPDQPGAVAFFDYPACGHNGGASFSFADGHTEARKWLDPRTIPAGMTPTGSGYPAEVPSLSKRKLIAMTLVAIAGAALIVTQTASSKGQAYKLEGAWTLSSEDGLLACLNLVPSDPSGHQATAQAHWVSAGQSGAFFLPPRCVAGTAARRFSRGRRGGSRRHRWGRVEAHLPPGCADPGAVDAEGTALSAAA